MARAVRKILRASGARVPSSANTPKAKAMSVAMGMPQPEAVSVPALKAR